MKIVFFGSGKFAVPILEALYGLRSEVALVVTQPDRKKGRHLHLASTPLKEYAQKHGYKIFQPKEINHPDVIQHLAKIEADLFIVVSYGRILSKEVLRLPKIHCLNIHASLLPKYRGGAPVNRVLMNGEKKTGITFIRMNEYLDKGDIILQKTIRIHETDQALSLEKRLTKLASSCLKGVLINLQRGKVRYKKQDNRHASYAPLMKKQDGLIRWHESAQSIYNTFRGCFGWPGTYTFFKGKILKVFKMRKSKHQKSGQPGQVVDIRPTWIEVACGKGSILIEEVLPESHRRMSIESFLAGHQMGVGDCLG